MYGRIGAAHPRGDPRLNPRRCGLRQTTHPSKQLPALVQLTGEAERG